MHRGLFSSQDKPLPRHLWPPGLQPGLPLPAAGVQDPQEVRAERVGTYLGGLLWGRCGSAGLRVCPLPRVCRAAQAGAAGVCLCCVRTRGHGTTCLTKPSLKNFQNRVEKPSELTSRVHGHGPHSRCVHCSLPTRVPQGRRPAAVRAGGCAGLHPAPRRECTEAEPSPRQRKCLSSRKEA